MADGAAAYVMGIITVDERRAFQSAHLAGELLKSKKKTWDPSLKARWFELDGKGPIRYYRTKGGELLGTIRMEDVSMCKVHGELQNPNAFEAARQRNTLFCFELVTKAKPYFLFARDDYAMRQWVECVNAAVSRRLSLGVRERETS